MKTSIACCLLALAPLLLESPVSALELTGGPPVTNVQSASIALGLPSSSSLGFALSAPRASGFNAGSGAVSGSGSELAPASGPTVNLGSFDILINPGATLAGNAAALAAFNRAAKQWENRIADPINVNIHADLASLGAGIIGSTSAVFLQAGYNTIRNQMVLDAADETDDAIVASVPSAAGYLGILPGGGFSFTGNMVATKANLKAMGFAGLDGAFGANDADITFSSSFAFDFDNSNGVTAGQLDFETVAAHEIGHALGFISGVDDVDFLVGVAAAAPVDIYPLDLFRFEEGTANDPATAANFATFPRSMTSNTAANTDDIAHEWRMSTGSDTGDGRQASHWRDDLLGGSLVGVMDPTLSAGVVELVALPDLRALDVIGYEIVPEPASFLLLAMGMIGIAAVGRLRTR